MADDKTYEGVEEVEAHTIDPDASGINWAVRLKSKWFWMAIIPMILLLIQQIAAMFGFTLNFETLQAQILAIVETVFMILGILGIIVDPTTKGFSDSARALTYTEPN